MSIYESEMPALRRRASTTYVRPGYKPFEKSSRPKSRPKTKKELEEQRARANKRMEEYRQNLKRPKKLDAKGTLLKNLKSKLAALSSPKKETKKQRPSLEEMDVDKPPPLKKASPRRKTAQKRGRGDEDESRVKKRSKSLKNPSPRRHVAKKRGRGDEETKDDTDRVQKRSRSLKVPSPRRNTARKRGAEQDDAPKKRSRSFKAFSPRGRTARKRRSDTEERDEPDEPEEPEERRRKRGRVPDDEPDEVPDDEPDDEMEDVDSENVDESADEGPEEIEDEEPESMDEDEIVHEDSDTELEERDDESMGDAPEYESDGNDERDDMDAEDAPSEPGERDDEEMRDAAPYESDGNENVEDMDVDDEHAEEEEEVQDKEGEAIIQQLKDPHTSAGASKMAGRLGKMSSKRMDHLKEFEPIKDLPENFFMIMYGMRRCGKSTCLNHLLWSMRKRFEKYKVVLFSGTAKVDPEQYKYYPPGTRFHDLEVLEDELRHIIEEQEDIMGDVKNAEKMKDDQKVLIVLDDVVNEKTVRTSTSLGYMAVSGRHIGASVIILSQMLAGSGSVPPIIRTQADVIIMCTLPRSQNERKLLSEWYLTVEDTASQKDQGRKMLKKITDVQYRCMVVTMHDTSARRTRDYVMTYGPVNKDDVPEDFKLGHPEQWEEEEGKDSSSSFNTFANTGEDGEQEEGEEDESAPQDVRGAHDIHAGGKTNEGNMGAEVAQNNRLQGGILNNQVPDTSDYLPPAFSNGRKPMTFRSFVQYSIQGSSNQKTAEGGSFQRNGVVTELPEHQRLQGQRFDRPDRPKDPRKKMSKFKKRMTSRYSQLQHQKGKSGK